MDASRALVAILLAGCSFRHGAAPGAGDADSASDADGSIGDAIDGPPGDVDGDGIPDGSDNCPGIANPLQRDWDHDGHGDECDKCPHLPSATDPDADGDGVGDACDPQPGVTDHRILWLGFYDPAEITGWRNYAGAGTWTVQNNALDETAMGSILIFDAPTDHGDVYFATRMEVASTLSSASTEIGFCGGDIAQGHQYYCCSINGTGVRATSAWETVPASGGQLSTPAGWSGSLAVGAQIDVTGKMTATQSQCTFAQGGVAAAAATTRGTLTPGAPCFYTQANALGRWRYLFVVAQGT